jgi:NCS1 family nucleobase:cation symporter-1
MPRRDVPSPLTRSIFSGRPATAGDLSVETHGIAPLAED